MIRATQPGIVGHASIAAATHGRRWVVAVGTLLAIAAILLCGLCAPLHAEEAAVQDGPVQICAVTVDQPPAIDGILDDACWQQATHIEGFWRTGVDAPELERTEVWLCYDKRAIYVAFRCHDTKAAEIRCDQKKRQGNVWRDDLVEFWLDVENKGRGFYGFCVNPAGTQYDSVPGGTSEKIEWRGDWRAAARRDEAGWSAEMEIPFSILRYPEGQSCFRFNLERRLARTADWDRSSVWPPAYARVQDEENCARWADIETPPVPFRYVLMPYALSVFSENEEDRELLTAGVDFKGTFPNGMVGLATYNPDFRNIEDVVETIDFTFVERWLPEYRPFFREGGEYVPSSLIFYSRRIGELDWGAKTFGTVGANRFGLLDAYRGGGENHLAWRYDRLFGTKGTLSFSGVDRRVSGDPDNLALALGGDWNRPFSGGGRYLYASSYYSSTEGEGGDDRATSAGAGIWRRQGWNWSADYSRIGSEFQADDGYLPETGVQQLYTKISHSRLYDQGPLESLAWYLGAGTGRSEDGDRDDVYLDYVRRYRSGWVVCPGVSRGERDGFDVVDNNLNFCWNTHDIYRGGHFKFTQGERYGQTYRYQALRQAFHPTQRWSGELLWERAYAADLDDDGSVVPPEWSRQLVVTATCDIGDERSISGRLVRGEDGTNFYAGYRQRVRQGTDVLVVLGDPNAEEWVTRLAVKAIWCY